MFLNASGGERFLPIEHLVALLKRWSLNINVECRGRLMSRGRYRFRHGPSEMLWLHVRGGVDGDRDFVDIFRS